MNPLVILLFCLFWLCQYGWNDAAFQPVGTFFKSEALEYPGQNKTKGTKIEALWKQYYKCLDVNFHSSIRREQIASSLMVLKGQSVKLPCHLICQNPRQSNVVKWFMKRKASDKIATEIDYTNKMVSNSNGSLHIYQTSEEDDAIYYCKQGASDGGVVLLEITDDEEPLSTAKFDTSKAVNTTRLAKHSMQLYTRWHPWTACSSCGETGIRHQTGICYIKYVASNNASSQYTDDEKDYVILKAFPEGLPCRSKYLPYEIKEIFEVKHRNSELITASCKIICNMDNVTAKENSGMIHNYQQLYHAKPPARQVLFLIEGESAKVFCPRHAFTDATIRWRIGTDGQFLTESTDVAKVFVNAREQIIINNINVSDDNIYSCWQLEELVGTVKLYVKPLHRYDFDLMVTIANLCIISAVFLLCIGRMIRVKSVHKRETLKAADI